MGLRLKRRLDLLLARVSPSLQSTCQTVVKPFRRREIQIRRLLNKRMCIPPTNHFLIRLFVPLDQQAILPTRLVNNQEHRHNNLLWSLLLQLSKQPFTQPSRASYSAVSLTPVSSLSEPRSCTSSYRPLQPYYSPSSPIERNGFIPNTEKKSEEIEV